MKARLLKSDPKKKNTFSRKHIYEDIELVRCKYTDVIPDSHKKMYYNSLCLKNMS